VTAFLLAIATPVAPIALPAAVLLLVAGPRGPGPRALTVLLAAFGVWWLLGIGDLPDQTLRAAALLATTAFTILSVRTGWSVTHRALLALGVAAAGTAALYLALGWSWDQLLWWVEFRTGAALRPLLVQLAAGSGGSVLGSADFETTLDDLIHSSGTLFPAGAGVQLLVSLALAAVLVRRVAGHAVGRPVGRLADFRFSEHLGWLLALALGVVLIPQLAVVRPLGLNVLVVMGTLYALRGLAVIAFGIHLLRGGCALYVAAALALFFLMPGVVLLGVVDAGLDLRRRWSPSTGA
jgi:hypothetical protein